MSEAASARAQSPVARPPTPPRLYAIADGDALGLGAVEDAVEAMAEAGVRWIQLRLKRAEDRRRYEIAARCAERLEGSSSSLWIDDRADLAALLPVCGVHVGQTDLPPPAARQVVGEDRLIGCSCHDPEQVRRADRDAAVDVVAIGPIFDTTSKQAVGRPVGLAGVVAARRATGKPLVAIGGIDAANALAVLEAGADTVVMLGAVCRGDVGANCRRLTALLEDTQ